jgi:hypothetical protein
MFMVIIITIGWGGGSGDVGLMVGRLVVWGGEGGGWVDGSVGGNAR